MIIKKKVLCFSATCFKGFEYKDLELVNKLKNYFEVTYAVKSHKMFLKYVDSKNRSKISIFKKLLKKINDDKCGFPGFDENFKSDIKFSEHQTIWIEKWTELKRLIKKHDVIILGTNRNSTWLIEYIRSLGKIVLIHKNPSTIDIDSNLTPNILCLKDNAEKIFVERQIEKKKIIKLSTKDIIKVTGTVQYTFDDKKIIDKNNFFKKYNLDINKNCFCFYQQLHSIIIVFTSLII